MIVALTRFDALGGALGRVPFGLTSPEMAAVMGALGCRQALLLDGGISGQLLVRRLRRSPAHLVQHSPRSARSGWPTPPVGSSDTGICGSVATDWGVSATESHAAHGFGIGAEPAPLRPIHEEIIDPTDRAVPFRRRPGAWLRGPAVVA